MGRVLPTSPERHETLDRGDAGGKCRSGDQMDPVVKQGQRIH